jgi:hypothetical protein
VNDIDKWEAEEATRQLTIIKSEDAAFAALPEEERVRIIKEKRDRLEAFAEVEESEEDEEEDEDD